MRGVALLAQLELPFLLANIRLGFAFTAQPHLFDCIIASPHDMEAVQDNGRVWKGLGHDVRHALGQIHRYFLDSQALLFRYPEQNVHDVIRLGPPDHGYHGASFAMPRLVGEYRKQVVLQGGLIDAQVLADVLFEQNPVRGMAPLLPLRKVAQ